MRAALAATADPFGVLRGPRIQRSSEGNEVLRLANVVVRSISGHLTEQMQQRYSTARGHEQESAIARIIDLTRVQRWVQEEGRAGRDSTGSRMDSKVDNIEGQHKVSG
jgi:hypothetical protein